MPTYIELGCANNSNRSIIRSNGYCQNVLNIALIDNVDMEDRKLYDILIASLQLASSMSKELILYKDTLYDGSGLLNTKIPTFLFIKLENLTKYPHQFNKVLPVLGDELSKKLFSLISSFVIKEQNVLAFGSLNENKDGISISVDALKDLTVFNKLIALVINLLKVEVTDFDTLYLPKYVDIRSNYELSYNNNMNNGIITSITSVYDTDIGKYDAQNVSVVTFKTYSEQDTFLVSVDVDSYR